MFLKNFIITPLTLIATLIATLSSHRAHTADLNIPSLSRCLADMSPANTRDTKVYNLYTDFYYEFDDKREFAAVALHKMVEQFAPANSACRRFSQTVNNSSIKCEKFAGSQVCIVPSDTGEFILVRDFVDSTNIILTEYDDDYSRFPQLDSDNNNEALRIPKPELCYADLLGALYDSQAYALDADSYIHFEDFRYVMARVSRDLVKKLATGSDACSYRTGNHSALDMQCLKRRNKPSICGISSTNAGYFVYVTDADNGVHVLFNRWD